MLQRGISGTLPPARSLREIRIVGLEQMLKAGFTIIRATASRMWDGDATLEVAESMRKGNGIVDIPE